MIDQQTQRGNAVHINRPPALYVATEADCPTCGTRERFAGYDQPWYGPTLTCLGCGDRFSDGERLPRPFKPRWRRESIAEAEQWWPVAVRLYSPAHHNWLRTQVAAETAVVAADGLVGAEPADSPHDHDRDHGGDR